MGNSNSNENLQVIFILNYFFNILIRNKFDLE